MSQYIYKVKRPHSSLHIQSVYSMIYLIILVSWLFFRSLSNTAPAYLESMQRLMMCVDEIDGLRDINTFAESHPELLQPHDDLPLELCKYKLSKDVSPHPSSSCLSLHLISLHPHHSLLLLLIPPPHLPLSS